MRTWLQRLGSSLARHLDRLGHGQAALADAEVDRRIDLGIVELHQYVVARDAEVRRAKATKVATSNERTRMMSRSRWLVVKRSSRESGVAEGRFRHDARARQNRRRFLQDATLGQCQDQLLVFHDIHTGWAGFHGVGQGSPTSPK